MRKYTLYFFLFLCIKPSFSQVQRPHIIKYDENDGLKTSNYIGDLKADKDGFLWIVNFNNISRYDGITFKEIEAGKINHNALLRFIESPNGSKVVFDYSGLLYFIEKDSLKPYEFNPLLKSLNLKNGSVFTDLYFDKLNRLHISYNHTGYLIIDNNKVRKPIEENGFNLKGEIIILKKDGSIFSTFTTKGKWLTNKLYVVDESFNILDSTSINKKEYNYPVSKTKFKDGFMFYSSGFGNFYKISRLGKIQEIEFNHPIVNLFQDTYNTLWISTFEKGVFQFKNDKVDESNVFFPNTTSILSEQDLDGDLWVFSYEEGLMQLSYPNYLYFNKSFHPSFFNNISSLSYANGKLLMGHSGEKILSYDVSKKLIDSIQIPSTKGKIIESIYTDTVSNTLWYSQRGGLFYKTENETWSRLRTDKISGFNNRSKVKFIGYDSYSDCNIALFDRRYYLFRDTTVTYISPEFQDELYTVLKQQNRTFISTYSGIFKQEGQVISSMAKEFPQLNELAHSFTEFNDEVIISVKNGNLYGLRNDSLKPKKVKEVEIKNAFIYKLNEDSLWCFSNLGSFLIHRGSEIEAYEKLPEKASASIVGMQSGVFWSVWNKGLQYTPFKIILKNKLKPVKLRLNEIRINGEKKNIKDSVFQSAYNKSFIQIAYQSITYRDWPVTYRYKMLGLNKDWIVTPEKSIQFTTLPIGEYNFELQSKMGDQVWSKSIRLKFEVLPPIWRTWWFILICILLFSTVVFSLISYRFKTIKREKDLVIDKLKAEQRALRAQMDPHFVFNVVASAQYLVMKEENEKAVEFLNMFSRLMRSILDHSNSNQISLEQEIKFLEDYVNLEHFRLEKSFDFKLNKRAIKLEQNQLVPPFIIQPFIENAIHHGLKNKDGEKSLYVEFKIEKGYLVVQVNDTGIGRENAGKFISEEKRKRKSHGIRIIKERLALHNNRKQGNISYSDPAEGGTHVTVKIKLDQT